ncbi:MAG: formylglycine-generating enzyme family protein [Terriglobales bacterium]
MTVELTQPAQKVVRIQLKAEVEATPAGASKVNPKDNLTYVWIPSGKFQMGCSPGDSKCGEDEKPRHEVTITKGFWMGQTAVTQEAYQHVTEINPSHFHGDQLPVENVTWDDAVAYCTAVGMKLPTEAEWEYAARAGSTALRYRDVDAIAWHEGNSGNQTHAVGLKQPNAWKLYDMLGNVWQWTADWYDPGYYAHSESQDPEGPTGGKYRTLRGGSWGISSRLCRASLRFGVAPDSRDSSYGFRCVGQ